MNTDINIQICEDDIISGSYTENITYALVNLTGFEISEFDFINGVRNDCWVIQYNGTGILLVYDPVIPMNVCSNIIATYPFCGNDNTITINIEMIVCSNNDILEEKRKYGTFDIGDLGNPQNLTGYVSSVIRTQITPNPQSVRYSITFTEPFYTSEYSPIINLQALSPHPDNPTVTQAIENKTVNGFDLLLKEFAPVVQNLSVIIEVI